MTGQIFFLLSGQICMLHTRRVWRTGLSIDNSKNIFFGHLFSDVSCFWGSCFGLLGCVFMGAGWEERKVGIGRGHLSPILCGFGLNMKDICLRTSIASATLLRAFM